MSCTLSKCVEERGCIQGMLLLRYRGGLDIECISSRDDVW